MKSTAFTLYPDAFSFDIQHLINTINRVISGEHDSHPPLRVWWQDDTEHYLKIDHPHYCDKVFSQLAQHLDFEKILAEHLTTAHTLQLWSSTLYHFDHHQINSVGLHTDKQFIDFIKDDQYLSIWIPISESGPTTFITGQQPDSQDITAILNPLESNLDLQQALLKENSVTTSTVELTFGDILICEPECIRGIRQQMRKTSVLVLYVRSEHAKVIPDKEDYGTCSLLDDLELSPIVYYKRSEE